MDYLKKYNNVCLLDERLKPEEEAEKLTSFIKAFAQVEISEDYCQKLFYHSTPQAFVDMLQTEIFKEEE